MSMYCMNCGAELKDNTKFCGRCGTPVAAPVNAEAARAVRGGAPAPAFAPAPEAPRKTGKKKGGKKLPVVILAAAVVVGGGAFAAKNLLHMGGGTPIVYETDDALMLLKDAGDEEAIELASSTLSTAFDPNGKYLYYVGSDRTLYRAEYKKLKPDSENNDRYIEEMETEVISYHILDDGGIVVGRESGKLEYIKKDGTVDVISTSCRGFCASENCVLYTVWESGSSDAETYALYRADLNHAEESTAVATGIQEWRYNGDGDGVSFAVYQNHEYVLYYAGFDGTVVKLGTCDHSEDIGFTAYLRDDNGNYILASEGQTYALSADAESFLQENAEEGFDSGVFMAADKAILRDNTDLYMAEISGGKIGSFEQIAENVVMASHNTMNGNYYSSILYIERGDLYAYLDDENLYAVTEKGITQLMVPADNDNWGNEIGLTMLDNGEFICSDRNNTYVMNGNGKVTDTIENASVRMDQSGKFYYEEDGRLYQTDGKKKTKLAAKDVEWFIVGNWVQVTDISMLTSVEG